MFISKPIQIAYFVKYTHYLNHFLEDYKQVTDIDSYIESQYKKESNEKVIHLPEELYSTKREAIEDEIEETTRSKVAEKYLSLDAILVRDVTLPQTLRAAIEQKLKQEQESLEYEFKITLSFESVIFNIIESDISEKPIHRYALFCS